MRENIIVQKFGGSSVENTDKLKLVSEHIIKEYLEGKKVTVVVSAQGNTTDRLIKEEHEITDNPVLREHDVLVSTGEQITGWQLPIITDGNFTEAKIKYINSDKIKKYLNDDYIVIIAGFQGIDDNNNITTLGRGGSDTTAVAVAAALNADKCDIYTDVDGIYSSDPRIINNVKKIETISYDEMLELASMGAKVLHNRSNPDVKKYRTISYNTMIEMAESGAKVLHDRCVKIGQQFKVPMYVKSTFEKLSKGTLVTDKEDCFY